MRATALMMMMMMRPTHAAPCDLPRPHAPAHAPTHTRTPPRSVLLWHRSDNLSFCVVLGSSDEAPIACGTPVECKIKGVLQARVRRRQH